MPAALLVLRWAPRERVWVKRKAEIAFSKNGGRGGGDSTWGIFPLSHYIICSRLYLPFLYHHKALPTSQSLSVFFLSFSFIFFFQLNFALLVLIGPPFCIFLNFSFLAIMKTTRRANVLLNGARSVL